MADITYTEELVISNFTLALFNDLGYLQVKHNYTGGLMRFGKNKGCDFINEKCYDEANLTKYENEFFYPTNIDSTNEEQSCSSGRLSKTIYKLHNYEEDILIEEYRYFSGYPKIGGSLPSAHYCPIAQTDSETTFGGLCSNINNNPNNERGESYSKNSFCALSSLIKNTINNNEEISEEYYSTCFEMFCSSKSLTIKVGEDYLVCPREGGKIGGINFNGHLLCPDYNLICTGSEVCNNIFDWFKAKSIDKYDSYYYKKEEDDDDNENLYSIKTTQDKSSYTAQGISIGWELTNKGICPIFCSQCDKNKNCLKCATYYKLVDNKCEEIVKNCKEYNSDGESCKTCDDDYAFVDSINTACYKKTNLENDKYFVDQSNSKNYIKCSTAILNCLKCSNENYCSTCKTGFAIIGEDNFQCKDLSTNE